MLLLVTTFGLAPVPLVAFPGVRRVSILRPLLTRLRRFDGHHDKVGVECLVRPAYSTRLDDRCSGGLSPRVGIGPRIRGDEWGVGPDGLRTRLAHRFVV